MKPNITLRNVFLSSAFLLIVACAGNQPAPNQIFLMPAPGVYEEGRIDPFIDNDPISRGVKPSILFATDRKPAESDDSRYEYFTHERGHVLRLGVAEITLGLDEAISWEEARRVSLLKNRTADYPLEISKVETFGVLSDSISALDDNTAISTEPESRFAKEIDERLAISPDKDVYIYVHGYKVDFENPILVASEIWHFLGYNGAFIAYSWPTKRSTWTYLADIDSAVNTGRNLRTLILNIAANTDAEKIHVIGYSMGTRAVIRMLSDFGMYGFFLGDEEIDAKAKLGNVLLIGSDIDRNILSGYLQDGALRIPDALTIYQSSADTALRSSRRIFGRKRAGQVVEGEKLGQRSRQFFDDNPQLRIIDVTAAEGSTSGNGHHYFRKSPWVSSDILMTLMYDLAPADRGLKLREDLPIWSFPDDYLARLRRALADVNPALAN